jgi:cytoskeleton protein RodZ
MSEAWVSSQPGAEVVAAAAEGASAGALLRRAREAAGLHVAALAVSLKVPVRKLEALEDDRYDLLTDAVFVRALASSVCRTLKIDAQPVLERLPQMAAPRLVRTREGLNEPFRAPGDGAPPTWLEQLGQPVFLAVFALLLGALVLIFLPKVQAPEAASTEAKPAIAGQVTTAAQPLATSILPEQSVTKVLAQPAAAASGAAATVLLPAAAPAKPASASIAPAAAKAASSSALAAPTTPAPMPAPAQAKQADGGGIVVFRTRAPSWVEVTDARGEVAVRRVLSAGEEAMASGALPLQVTVGRVDSTEVQVRGKPFDLRRVSRDNVARFEVK